MYGAFAAGFIIFVGLRWKLVVIENRFILFLGRISYSLYLIHYNVSEAFLILAKKATGNSVEDSLPWCLAAVGVSILAAWAMNVAIEQPALRWSKRLAPRRDREKQAPVPATLEDAVELPI
jgi:peptidoglycan/LPS O-acetylase OafA/YrhL